ncbi:MAG: Gx transporter family protein [Vallitaleaceae bacterium]|nr:Gx transporter family protein [Vallitaleaceae bacterium]
MQSYNKMSKVKKMVLLALLISMALVLSYFERFIPLPIAFPGVKLGLANAITLTALYFFNFRDTFTLVFLRVILNAIFVANMMSFWYSLSGGLLSLLIMFVLIKILGDRISVIGVSVAGAFFHNVGQLLVVAFVTKSVAIALTYLPILSIAGVISGIMIGVLVKLLMPYLRKNVFVR